MNELDSEVMKGMLERRGLVRVDDEDTADLLLFNTCSVRDLAERKVLGKIGKLGRSRTDSPIIGVAGCMANAKKERLLEKLPHIDFVLGTNNIHCLNEVIDEVLAEGSRVVRADPTFYQELDYHGAHNETILFQHASRLSVDVISTAHTVSSPTTVVLKYRGLWRTSLLNASSLLTEDIVRLLSSGRTSTAMGKTTLNGMFCSTICSLGSTLFPRFQESDSLPATLSISPES